MYNGKKIVCIYCVQNMLNNKIYIGQTTNYRKRISEYRCLTEAKKNLMPIYREILRIGHKNFKLFIIKRCKPKSLTRLEDYYIRKFKSYDSKYGYNLRKKNRCRNTNITRKRMSLAHIGLKSSLLTKQKKSFKIYAINGNDLIISDGAKLFSDYINTTRTIVTSAIRKGIFLQEYYIFYKDYDKRQDNWLNMINIKKRYNKNIKYIKLLRLIDNIETEGVETIYSYWNIYKLEYDENQPYKLTQLSCLLTGKA